MGNMSNYQIEYFDNQDNLLTFFVEITSYVNQPAQGKWADSDWDCYGYEEIEFTITSVTMTNENGITLDVTKDIDTDEYVDYLEEKLLEMVREDAEEDIDYPEPDYYDY